MLSGLEGCLAIRAIDNRVSFEDRGKGNTTYYEGIAFVIVQIVGVGIVLFREFDYFAGLEKIYIYIDIL